MFHIIKPYAGQENSGIVAIEPARSMITMSQTRGGNYVHYNLPLPWIFFSYNLSFGSVWSNHIGFAKEYTLGDTKVEINFPYIPNILRWRLNPAQEHPVKISSPQYVLSRMCSIQTRSENKETSEEQKVASFLQKFYQMAFITWGDNLFFSHPLVSSLEDRFGANGVKINAYGMCVEDRTAYAHRYYSLLESMEQEEINSFSWGPSRTLILNERTATV